MDCWTKASLSHDQPTLDFYEREASAYAANAKSKVSRWLEDFMEALPAGAQVLDLGCGAGQDAEAMLGRGFDVDAADGSSAMAAQAEQLLKRPVKIMRFDELSANCAYDGVWANASLLHVPFAALIQVLMLVFQALKPGGVQFATYKSGTAAGRDALGRYYNYPNEAALLAAYAQAAPWSALTTEKGFGSGYDGEQCSWIAVTAHRSPPPE